MHKGFDNCQEFTHVSGHFGGQKSGQTFPHDHATLPPSDNNDFKKVDRKRGMGIPLEISR